MNYKLFISSLLVTLATAVSAYGNAGDPQPPPKKEPIRYANGTATVTKTTIVEDATSGKVFFKRELVCKKDAQVPVFDFRDPGTSFYPARVDCETLIDGKMEKISTMAQISYSKFSLYEGAPKEDYKMASVFNWIGNPNQPSQLEAPPYQNSVTRDLQQKNFILISANPQGQTCSGDSNVGAKGCTYINPIAFEIVWDIQDTQ